MQLFLVFLHSLFSRYNNKLNADWDICNRGSEVPEGEISTKSAGNADTGSIVQHNTSDKQPGIGNDGQATGATETADSTTRDRKLSRTGAVQHLDQRHSSGDSTERGSENPKIIGINQESSQSGGSDFLVRPAKLEHTCWCKSSMGNYQEAR
ncbi:MAG: hypothetical protein ACYDG2_20215 [Ruminiclostridium sp.]